MKYIETNFIYKYIYKNFKGFDNIERCMGS